MIVGWVCKLPENLVEIGLVLLVKAILRVNGTMS